MNQTVQTLMATGAPQLRSATGSVWWPFGLSTGTDVLLPGQHAVSPGHVVEFLRNHIVEHRAVPRAAGSKDPTLALLPRPDVGWVK